MKKLVLLMMFLLVLTSCTSGTNNDTTVKELTLIKNADIMSMDSSKATDEMSFEVISTISEGLYSIDAQGLEREAMVESVEASDDGLTHTFKLKDAKWSNGDPVTANDFVFAFRRLVDPATASEYAFIMDVAGVTNAAEVAAGEKPVEELGVEATDDKTFVMHLSRQVPFLYKVLAFPSFYPLNEDFVTEQGDQYALAPENLISNGPWVMKEWISGNSFSVERNEEYYDNDVVKIDKITWKLAMDAQSAVLEFENGAADFVRITGDIIENYKDNEQLQTALGGYMWFLSVNTEVEALANNDFTKALGNAVDRSLLSEQVLKDGAVGAGYFVPRLLATSPTGVDFRDDNGTDFFNEGKEAAKGYWKSAQAQLGDTVELELLYEDTDESKKVAEFIKGQVEEALTGVTLNLKSQPKKSRIELMRAGDYQLALHRWGPDYPDPMTYLDLYLTGSSNNMGGYSNPEFDDLIDKAVNGGLSVEDRWATMLQAEKVLLENGDGPIPIYQTGNSIMWSDTVTGVEYHTTGVSYYYKFADKK